MKPRFILLSTWWWMVLIPILALLPCAAMAKEATLEEQLLQAAAQGDAVRIKTLLNRGADVNAKRDSDGTALVSAVRGGPPEDDQTAIG